MAHITDDISRTFSEFLILPGLTKRENIAANIDLTTTITSKSGKALTFNIPFFSSAMQSVSGVTLSRELAKLGGIGFIYCSQPVEIQADMVKHVKQSGYTASDFPDASVDDQGRLLCGAAVNTHDYQDRLPAIVEAGADIVFFDSSDGYSEYQHEACHWARKQFGDDLIIGGGNIVDARAFHYLVEDCGFDFVKIGIGGGSICTTREQKGIGRGQASAVIEIAAARDAYFEKTGRYIPICSDGGLRNDTQMIMALALGADCVMMGKYFAMMQESPTEMVTLEGKAYKQYWGEGSNRAKNQSRYSDDKKSNSLTKFEEGVDSLVPCTGSIHDIVPVSLSKLKSTMSSCGVNDLAAFRNEAVLTVISPQSFEEGGTGSVLVSR